MLRFSLYLFLLCCSPAITAQFDTIAGPFVGTLNMTSSEDNVFVTSYTATGANIIRSYTGEEIDDSGDLVFAELDQTPIADIVFHRGDLFAITTKQPIVAGSEIFRIEDINGPIPMAASFLEVPWPAGSMAFYGDTLFLFRAALFGGGIFSYDTSDPEAALELFLDGDFSDFDQFAIIVGDILLFSNAAEGNVSGIDLSVPNPAPFTIINNVDSPRGLAYDDGRLYVAEANANNNTSSQVNVYAYEDGTAGSLIESIGQNTALPLLEVARLNGRTYILEAAVDFETDPGYLLRIALPSSVRVPKLETIEVAPNPASHWVAFTGDRPLHIRAFDQLGRSIALKIGASNRIDVSSLPAGSYLLRFQMADGSVKQTNLVVNRSR